MNFHSFTKNLSSFFCVTAPSLTGYQLPLASKLHYSIPNSTDSVLTAALLKEEVHPVTLLIITILKAFNFGLLILVLSLLSVVLIVVFFLPLLHHWEFLLTIKFGFSVTKELICFVGYCFLYSQPIQKLFIVPKWQECYLFNLFSFFAKEELIVLYFAAK